MKTMTNGGADPMRPITQETLTFEDLRLRRDEILRLAEQHGAYNVRVFGSVARDEATPTSDVDFIAAFRDGTTIFDLVGLWQDLQDLLRCEVDLIADHPSGGRVMRAALREAISL
jgi:predicted nucleotidyltransferase